MKERTLIYLSLVVSTLTLGYAVWLHQHAEQMATEALRKREREIVTYYAPKLRPVYLDMLGKTNALPQNPQTLEELLSPLVIIFEQLGELPEAPKKTETPK